MTRLIALLLLALVTCGCVVYQCPSTARVDDAVKLDALSGYNVINCPPSDKYVVGSCLDGCNMWSCDVSGMCSVTSLYCPKDGLWITTP